jgi:predicted nucleic acid-binding protein
MSVMGDLGYLDTNLFVHVLYPNDPHYPRCRAILSALADDQAIGWLDAIVVYELTFILARRRRFPDRQAIARYVRGIIEAPGVMAPDKQVLIAALDRWVTQGVGFADAWLYVRSANDGKSICSANSRDFGGVQNTY